MSQTDEDALLLNTHKYKNEFGTYFVADNDQEVKEAYQDFEDDMDCNMALEVTYNYYSHINYI